MARQEDTPKETVVIQEKSNNPDYHHHERDNTGLIIAAVVALLLIVALFVWNPFGGSTGTNDGGTDINVQTPVPGNTPGQ